AEVLPAGSKYACGITKTGYTVEAAVPWAALGWQPQAGDRLFFAGVLVDYDKMPDGKLGPLKQVIWHQPMVEARPMSRTWAEARLLSAGGYGAELMTAMPVVKQGESLPWKMQVDAAQPGWQVTKVAIVGPENSTRTLVGMTPVQPHKRLLLAGQVDTSTLKPGLYALEATAVKGKQTETTRQPVNVLDSKSAINQAKVPALPQQWFTPDPLRSYSSAEYYMPLHKPINHAEYLAFVKNEMETAWPSFDYHLRNKTLTLGGGWYQEYGLRIAAYAVVTKDPVWAQRAQGMFEMANASYKANNYAGISWISFPLLYYYKHYLTTVNAWKPEYDGMVQDWYLHTYPHIPAPKQLYYGMNNWGLSSGIMGIAGKYWLGEALPDKDKWEQHVADTWGIFFGQVRDIDENTTNYAIWDLWNILVVLDMTGQTNLLKTDPKLRYLFERYLYEVAPSGARPHYGATNGFHDAPAAWMYVFERVGQITGDGRYKYQARRIWDYCIRHVDEWHAYHVMYDNTLTYLTRLLAEVPDDSLPEQPIEAKSILTTRGTMRFTTAEERAAKNLMIDMKPDPVPNKLMLRSSNEPGSLWAMIELNNEAGHCPARPTSVNCLMDHETVLLASQGYNENDPLYHNMLYLEDLEGTQGIQPEMKISVPVLRDGKNVTYAVAEVERYMRWPVTLQRHYFFAKDRFLWVRDVLVPHATFFTRVGPCWLSRQMGPVSGKDWVNTYIDFMPYTGLGQGGGFFRWKNYNYDLLTYFVPRPGMSLTTTDLTSRNPYMTAPLQVRQAWMGLAKEGQTMAFDSLLIPHMVKTRVPDATWLAQTIQPLATDPQQTAIQFELPWRNEKVVVVTTDKPFTGGGITTDAKMAMVIFQGDKVIGWYVYQGTILKAGENVLFSNATPADGEK
ncbi:MAG TPA: hypothetical protein VGM23_08375, partial [Armatimonadota bacterium]